MKNRRLYIYSSSLIISVWFVAVFTFCFLSFCNAYRSLLIENRKYTYEQYYQDDIRNRIIFTIGIIFFIFIGLISLNRIIKIHKNFTEADKRNNYLYIYSSLLIISVLFVAVFTFCFLSFCNVYRSLLIENRKYTYEQYYQDDIRGIVIVFIIDIIFIIIGLISLNHIIKIHKNYTETDKYKMRNNYLYIYSSIFMISVLFGSAFTFCFWSWCDKYKSSLLDYGSRYIKNSWYLEDIQRIIITFTIVIVFIVLGSVSLNRIIKFRRNYTLAKDVYRKVLLCGIFSGVLDCLIYLESLLIIFVIDCMITKIIYPYRMGLIELSSLLDWIIGFVIFASIKTVLIFVLVKLYKKQQKLSLYTD